MVKKIIAEMSLTGNGLRDWLVQRISSLVIAIYFFVLLGFFLCHYADLDYHTLRHFFSTTTMQAFTLTTLLCLLLHAWVGMWTVVTDYIKPASIRIVVEALIILALVIYFFWGAVILLKIVIGA